MNTNKLCVAVLLVSMLSACMPIQNSAEEEVLVTASTDDTITTTTPTDQTTNGEKVTFVVDENSNDTTNTQDTIASNSTADMQEDDYWNATTTDRNSSNESTYLFDSNANTYSTEATDIDTTTVTSKSVETTPYTGTSYHKQTSYKPLTDDYFFTDCGFIGDSLTVGMSMYGLIPSDKTFAQEGINTISMLDTPLSTDYGYIYSYQAMQYFQAKHVYIMLGINGVSWLDNQSVVSAYASLIRSIQQNDQYVKDINVISVLPVAYSKECISSASEGRILNSEIDALNSQLEAMANSLGVNYINANPYFKNSNGCLYDELNVDGLHLTKEGYSRLIDILLQDAQIKNYYLD